MKFKKLLLFLFILPLLFIGSFSSAGQVSSSCSISPGDYGDGLTLCILPVPTLDVGSVYWSCQLVGFDGTIPSPSSDNSIRPVQRYSNNGNSSSLSSVYPFEVYYSDFFGGNSFSNTFNNSSAKLVYLSFDIRYFADWVSIGDNVSINCVFSGNNLLSIPVCPSQYTSEECQTEYGLVSSGVLNECQSDLNSCQSSLSGWNNTLDNCSNNLLSCQSSLSSCIAGNCPLNNDDIQWSSLFINNIQHVGAPIINITIPDEYSWDYTSSTGSFDLEVEGYNVDYEYMDNIIRTQNSKPTKDDLNNIITGLIPLFVPGLVIILFIYFVFKFIKKLF